MEFLHVADVHLGMTPDRGFPWSEQREQQIWDSFRRLIQVVGQEQLDLLLIAGDLFHGQPLMRELKEINYLFSSIPDTDVVLIAGNHDYIKKDSYYTGFAWAPNVTFLDKDTCSCKYLKRCDTYVYGMSYHQREIKEDLYNRAYQTAEDLKHYKSNSAQILLAHGGDEKHIPIHTRELLKVPFDYIALGHIHKPEIIQDGKMAYAGCLEPLEHNDQGPRGYIRGSIRDHETRIQFVPFATTNYVHLYVPIVEHQTQAETMDHIRQMMEAYGEQAIFKVILEGERAQDQDFMIKEAIYRLGQVVDVEDATVTSLDYEQLKEQYEGTMIGTYIDSFPKKGRSKLEEQALMLGVQALLEARRP